MSPLLPQKDRLLPQGPVLRDRVSNLPQVCKGGASRAALDMIWHIYSHLHCSVVDSGVDLPSPREVALTMGQVTCEFH